MAHIRNSNQPPAAIFYKRYIFTIGATCITCLGLHYYYMCVTAKWQTKYIFNWENINHKHLRLHHVNVAIILVFNLAAMSSLHALTAIGTSSSQMKLLIFIIYFCLKLFNTIYL